MQIRFFILLVALSITAVSCKGTDPVPVLEEGYLAGSDEAEIYYRVLGHGQDTLVVLHGGPGAGMHSILSSVKPLGKNHILILYDQRGGGHSELPADTTKLKPRYFVEDLEAVRRYFEIKKMNLLAHSFGSILAAEYARTYPSRIGRWIFHGATAPSLRQELELRKVKAERAEPPPDTALAGRASALLRKLLNGTAEDPVAACLEYEQINRKLAHMKGEEVTYRGTTCDAPPEAVRYYYRYTARLAPQYYEGWNFTDQLKQVTAPLLVLYGKRDSLMVPAQQSWASAVPNGRFLPVPNAGKSAFSDNPDFVFPSIDTFFRGEWPEAAQKVDGSQP